MIEVGSRVMYVHNNGLMDRQTGFYPPPRTLGTVRQITRSSYYVHWDSGTNSPHSWYCNKDHVIEYKGDENPLLNAN